jgi:hypothetical protein
MESGKIIDHTNNIEADLRYNPWSDNSYKGMFKKALKWGFSRKKEQNEGEREKRADDIHIKIYQLALNKKSEDKVEIASGDGSWMSYLMMDGKTYWRIEDALP